ncbi:methyltransferase domain-containing protein, partial [Pseudomonas aeruginosa]|uniref:methyltransferase domain-containing protein n=1 Tax=Pseudomonas aeruginosa TaxID=287 RepID=UPI003CC52746
ASHFIGGDAERLAMRDGSCDLLFSSLAIQWWADLPAVLAEARRLLRPGGELAFSSLCVGSQGELRDSCGVVDGFVHV